MYSAKVHDKITKKDTLDIMTAKSPSGNCENGQNDIQNIAHTRTCVMMHQIKRAMKHDIAL